jgi:TPR repeat protein
VAQDRLARVLADGRGLPKNPVEAVKWRLISKARGETDLMLDDFGLQSMIRKSLPLDLIRGWKPVFRKRSCSKKSNAETRAAGEEAGKPWLDALKKPAG